MAGIKISNLPAIVTPALTDVFPVVQGGITYKETFTQLSSLFVSVASLPLAVNLGGTGLTTTTVNQLLYAPTSGTIGGLATANSKILSTNGSGVPSFTNDILSGTFTPALQFGGAAVGLTYANRLGYYFKLGPFVFIRIELDLSAKGSSTGNATITGIPYAALTDNNWPINLPYTQNVNLHSSFLTGLVTTASAIQLYFNQTGAGIGTLADSDFANNSSIFLSGCYLTA